MTLRIIEGEFDKAVDWCKKWAVGVTSEPASGGGLEEGRYAYVSDPEWNLN